MIGMVTVHILKYLVIKVFVKNNNNKLITKCTYNCVWGMFPFSFFFNVITEAI